MLVGSNMMGLDGPAWLAFSETAEISRSPDGQAWGGLVANPLSSAPGGAAVFGSTVVAGLDSTLSGVGRSVNRGKSWSVVATGMSSVVGTTRGTGPDTVIATGYKDGVRGIVRSTDQGVTWGAFIPVPQLTTASPGPAIAGNGAIMYADSYGEMARSLDDGVTWGNVSTPTAGSVSVGNFTHVTGNIWVATCNYGYIVRSTDNGASWAYVTSPLSTSAHGQATAAGNGIVMACSGTGQIARSTDLGASWALVTAPFSTAVRSLAYANRTWLAGSTGGIVAVSTDDGLTWTELIQTPLTTDIYTLAFVE